MKLPAVHFGVNVAGVVTTIGAAAGWMLEPANQSCVNAALSPHAALAATAIAGVVAAFLPAKQNAKGVSNT